MHLFLFLNANIEDFTGKTIILNFSSIYDVDNIDLTIDVIRRKVIQIKIGRITKAS